LSNILNFPSLDQYLAGLKTSGGIWEFDKNKFAIKHLEVEKLAKQFNIRTTIDLVNCDLQKGCAVVKAEASYNGSKYQSLGEVSPLNNEWSYPISIAEKRAVDRVVLKALGIHGKYYSQSELGPVQRNENVGVKLDQGDIILERIKNTSHQANLAQLERENLEYLKKLATTKSGKAKEIFQAFKDRKQQLIGG
jgi:hypothetical protein